ncbi:MULTISPECIES: MaoC family dehydratase [Acinetobacter]|uniref:MaoC family dehydratase n=1 Tax=Acinetobacter TaxID=469 RepID=UPI0012E25B42|nr:MaoC family dehydratase [Acinetobacter indicus]
MYFSLEFQSDIPNTTKGYELIYKIKYSRRDVVMFSEITGDKNPIHTELEYARNTVFKEPIVHGFFVGSVFSRIFGTEYPGIGTIYLNQTMKFLAPVFLETFYYAKVILSDVDVIKGKANIITEIVDNDGASILVGEAKIMHNIYINQ